MSTDSAEGQEIDLNESQANLFSSLTKEDQEKLSKVLFPTTHTGKVTLINIERELHPLPIKYSRKIFSVLAPLSRQIQEAINNVGDTSHDLNSAVTDGLMQVAGILAEFYEWKDVAAAVKSEMITLPELQSLAAEQQEVNGSNDFLLSPLRICIRVMQIAEMVQLRFHSLLTMPPLLNAGA